jgi:hypothetical protein
MGSVDRRLTDPVTAIANYALAYSISAQRPIDPQIR